MLFGAAMIWVANQPLTWARTAFGAFFAWIEFVLLFGVVPSEWLNLSQGPLGWTSQNIAFTIPPWLVLGNEVADQLWCDQGRHLRGLLRGGLCQRGSWSPTCSRIGARSPPVVRSPRCVPRRTAAP